MAQFAPDTRPDVRFGVADVEQSGKSARRSCRLLRILVAGVGSRQAIRTTEVDDAHRLAVLALAGAVTAGARVDTSVTAVDHTGPETHPAAAGVEATVAGRGIAVHIGHPATSRTGAKAKSLKTARTIQTGPTARMVSR